MLTWIMFLKFLDDMEQIAEQEAKMSGNRFRPALEAPYRWRDWAARADGIAGDELISFVNNEEVVRPDGKRGPGLFAYLRGLQGAAGGHRRDVIATVFKGTVNRMINGYLLRDVINKVSDIHFTSSEEIHTLGHLYESMLKEMRDAASEVGDGFGDVLGFTGAAEGNALVGGGPFGVGVARADARRVDATGGDGVDQRQLTSDVCRGHNPGDRIP